jgi:hypothetical protein
MPKLSLSGYWSGQVENEAASKILQRPPFAKRLEITVEPDTSLQQIKLREQIYQSAYPILKLLNNDMPYPIENLKINKLSVIYALPKPTDSSTSFPIKVALYHIVPSNFENINYFFCTDEDQKILAYVRFHFKDKPISPDIIKAYKDTPYLSIEAIESHRSGYSFGSILIQAVIEFSLKANCLGRASLYSLENSGQFYFKLGFTPSKEEVYSELSDEHNINGEFMFLTGTAIGAWSSRVIDGPIFLADAEIADLKKPNMDDTSEDLDRSPTQLKPWK